MNSNLKKNPSQSKRIVVPKVVVAAPVFRMRQRTDQDDRQTACGDPAQVSSTLLLPERLNRQQNHGQGKDQEFRENGPERQ